MGLHPMVVPLLHLVATAAMVGLIWFVQVVHYPLFRAVGDDRFVAYEADHQRRTGFVVGPLMAAEGLCALWLVVDPPSGVGRPLPLVALGVLGVVHTSTVFLQVPLHGRLAVVTDPAERRRHIDRLVGLNWVRTVGWSARGVLAAALVVRV
ncbi:MAG: hypothetical protein FJW83_09765 [Actinobacteria bacterium]|nr:hypothetical protein [Actinomycetota bacterium]